MRQILSQLHILLREPVRTPRTALIFPCIFSLDVFSAERMSRRRQLDVSSGSIRPYDSGGVADVSSWARTGAQGATPVSQGWARTQKNEEARMNDTFVGVDVAKAEVVVACRPDGVGWTA